MPPHIYSELRSTQRNALDLDMRFFMHWTLLAGGTFSLLIPFVKSLETINAKDHLVYGQIFIIMSLICSALGITIVRILGHKLTKSVTDHDLNDRNFKRVNKFKERVSDFILVSYVVGIIFIALFINVNII